MVLNSIGISGSGQSFRICRSEKTYEAQGISQDAIRKMAGKEACKKALKS